MRLLHVTDTHLGIDGWYRGAPPGWRRGDDHLAALRHAVAPALRGEVQLVLHTGDLFDRSRPPASAVAAARELLAEVARVVPVLVLPGNHDRQGLRAHLGPPPPGLTIQDEPAAVAIAGLRIAVVPYFRTAEAWRAAAAVASRGGVDLLLAHQAFDGARVPGFTFRVGRDAETVGAGDLPPGVRHILCGHLHPRQALALGDAVVVMPGSSERTAFSERFEAKGTALWDLSTTPTWAFHDLPTRPMHLVQGASDLAALTRGALVRLDGAARTDDIEVEALARGAWVAPWSRARLSPQLGLFGSARPRRAAPKDS